MEKNKTGSYLWQIYALVVFMSIFPQVAVAGKTVATPAADVVPTASQVLAKILEKPFTFATASHSDPFMSFVQDRMIKAEAVAEANAQSEPLTGMQLFEPGQLDLVAILFSGRKALAMVQDSTGKGYIIKKGTKIGRRGQVVEIMPNTVVIKDWFIGSSGKKLYKNNEMVLRKEGGNK